MGYARKWPFDELRLGREIRMPLGRLADGRVPKTAWRWLFGLEQDGWIKTETKGNRWRATRFRYTGDGWRRVNGDKNDEKS